MLVVKIDSVVDGGEFRFLRRNVDGGITLFKEDYPLAVCVLVVEDTPDNVQLLVESGENFLVS